MRALGISVAIRRDENRASIEWTEEYNPFQDLARHWLELASGTGALARKSNER